jgi:hypothetical protein
MNAGDVDLQDLRDLVRMAFLQEPEERPDPLRDGLEQDHRLGARFDLPLPPEPRIDGEDARAYRKPLVERLLDPSERPGSIRVRRQDQPHRAPGVGGIDRVRGHPSGPPITHSGPAKLSVVVASVARSTIAARAGTGVMLRIF